MADIVSQEVDIEIREKLPDGTYKLKYPKIRPSVKGSWSTNSISIPSGQEYVHTIPLGRVGKQANIDASGLTGTNARGLIGKIINGKFIRYLAIGSGGLQQFQGASGATGQNIFSYRDANETGIALHNAYFSGTNLVLVFKNHSASNKTLVATIDWEVFI